MYLMSITNFDYIWISIFFAMLGLTAYILRRKNLTSNDFLYATTLVDKTVALFGILGILEITFAGYAGSVVGFAVVYFVWIILFVAVYGLRYTLHSRYRKVHVNDFNEYVRHRLGNATGMVVAGICTLLLMLLIILTLCLAFKLFFALLGWNFVNSIVGVTGLTLICLIIGGSRGVTYNKIIQLGIIILVLLGTVTIGIMHLGGINGILDNLNQLAIEQHKSANFYTHVIYNYDSLAMLALLLFGIGGFYLLDMHGPDLKVNGRQAALGFVSKSILVLLLVLPGILAITTKTETRTISGKDIVTVQAELPDGQIGYIVRAVPQTGGQHVNIPGIIPEQLDLSSGIAIKNQYNYLLATTVVMRHYLPESLQFLIILLIFAGFMLAVSTYLLVCCRTLLRHVLIPSGIIQKYGASGELWSIRLILLVLGFGALLIANFVAPHVDILQAATQLIVVLMAPLLAMLVLAVFIPRSITHIYVAPLSGVTLAIIVLYMLRAHTTLPQYAIISLMSFGVTLLIGVLINLVHPK